MITTDPARSLRVRRIGFGLIAVGGLFLVLGWGIGAEAWARYVGWVFTGIGFACEMVYERVLRPATRPEAEPQDRPADGSTP